MTQLKIANIQDIEGVLDLQRRYHIETIEERDKKDGFVTTSFTYDQLKKLVLKENGLFVAIDNKEVIAYTMSASWEYWAEWPMFKFMLEQLPLLIFLDEKITIKNSYQYGPICIDKDYRGTGLLEMLFGFAKQEMRKKYQIMLTFINRNNGRSLKAHIRKLNMVVIHEFQFNENEYYELALKII